MTARGAASPAGPLAPVAAVGLLAAVALALFALRLSLPSHLDDRGIPLYAAWVLDAVQNGRWIVPLNEQGALVTKPPLYVWLAALPTLAAGRASPVALLLPSMLATLGTATVIYFLGRRVMEPRAGLFAGLMYLLCAAGAAQIALARPDPVFTFTVTAAAALALRAWQLGRGWTWFWLAAAAATLAKGPLGVVLAAGGLLAAVWERVTGRRRPLRGSHALGLALFVVIAGGWFLLAYLAEGHRLIDRMIVGELVRHAVEDRTGSGPGHAAYVQPLTVLWSFAPWSLIAVPALWRVCRRPAPDDEDRRVERFLLCWFATGLILLSLAPHQELRHLFPILPPFALLAGSELSRRLPTLRPAALARAVAVGALVSLAAIGVAYHTLRDDRSRVVNTRGVERLARTIREQVGLEFPLVHVDTPFAFQLYLNTVTPLTSAADAAALLRRPAAAFVAVRDLDAVTEALGPGGPRLHEVARWPATGDAYLRVVSNHPRLEWAEDVAALFPPVLVELHAMRLVRRRGETFVLAAATQAARVAFTNQGVEALALRVRIVGPGAEVAQARVLAPGARWELGG